MRTTPSDPRRVLLEMASQMVANSGALNATLDAEAWLDDWLGTCIPALGGRKPEEMVGDSEGFAAVVRVLGAMESGAFQ